MNKQQRFEDFTAELAQLSKKYGIAIKSVGGVYITNEKSNFSKGEFKNLQYSNDASSNDLYFEIATD